MPDIRLLLVGGGYEEERLKQQAEAAGIARSVVFAGRVPHDQVQSYYDLVDVFVYPRNCTRVTELVTPLKPLEAMAQGHVVVASDVGGHKELIHPDKTGFLFRADDPDALAETVLRVFRHPDAAAKVQLNARKFVETERTWTASVGGYANVYSRLLSHPHYGLAH